MANSSEILQDILTQAPKTPHPITYQWLLPNQKGFDNYLKVLNSHSDQPNPNPISADTDNGPALNTSSSDPNTMPSAATGASAMASATISAQPRHEISIFLAATETFSRKNTNCSISESLDRFAPLISTARDNHIPVRAYISVALGCPYEGVDVSPGVVADLAVRLLEMGAYEISVADTTGMGTAIRTKVLLDTLRAAGCRDQDLALHFHDTFGQALVNAQVGLEHGVRTFDTAVAGLGGCPFSPGATGNVSTEDFVRFVEGAGLKTGVDVRKLAEIGEWISRRIGRRNESRAGRAMLANVRKEEGEKWWEV